MNIYFDNIIFSILKSGGISVVWKELLERIIESGIDYKCLEYNNAKDNIFRKQLNIPETRLLKNNYLFFKLQRYFNPQVNIGSSFIFHSSYYRVCHTKGSKNITTVHDFTYEYFSKGLKKFVHCQQKYNAIRKSDHIICVSENTKKDLIKFLPEIDQNKVSVVYNGVSQDYFSIQEMKEKYLPYPIFSYVVFVGSRGWYKNFKLAVEAIAHTSLYFVIIGNDLTKSEFSLLENRLKKRYKYLGKVSNRELNLVYNGAFCLLYPSAYEGFGIPVLEAQRAGCPVIAYNGSSIPEIIGETSLLFNNFIVADILNILNILKKENMRKNIIMSGYDNVMRFSWDIMYKNTVEIYKKLGL